MRRKAKGTRAERALLDKLWQYGVAAVRVAGSGSTSHPSSDIIAGYRGRIAVIEVKTSSKETIYIPPEEVNSMRRLADRLGGECWFAAKFSSDRGKFYLVKMKDARELESGSVVIDIETARSKGLSIEDFANELIRA
ncbi:MAG: Holliday junction resolvase [Candidatus Korarchaeota archaeon]|nr:Holliday junction resolvase [Candidatus Korarchaeota archaeon]